METIILVYLLGFCLSGFLASILYSFDAEFAANKTDEYLNEDSLKDEINELKMLLSEDKLIEKIQNLSIFTYSLYSWIGVFMLLYEWIKIRSHIISINKSKKDTKNKKSKKDTKKKSSKTSKKDTTKTQEPTTTTKTNE